MEYDVPTVWVFNGVRAQFPAAIFSTEEKAREWIERTGVRGTLTQYPLDESAYDWAIRNEMFRVKGPQHQTGHFIQGFSSGAMPHYHFVDDEVE
ncbi:MAG: hypothetical protein H6718_06085 [Polyangiaceae bacterium]|nr:hypothetical protein [Myxococcales bacterium]MCB9584946.1 hypothetical protein [Polyangiaceae bacterium]MCB9607481.1 hypothetical protein [Polyangiaceae bacterium]